MHWSINHTLKSTSLKDRHQEIISTLYQQRGLTNSEKIERFLNPPSPLNITPKSVGIDISQLNSAINRIQSSIDKKQPILIFGDYDADGITATAILWETLHSLGAKAIPFIPNREAHGYGLSVKALIDSLNQPLLQGVMREDALDKNLTGGGQKRQRLASSGVIRQSHATPLVITVDNGIVAHEAAKYLHDQKIDLIITDHHQPPNKLPICHSLVHTDQIAGSAVAWILAKELSPDSAQRTLDLVTIGTVADMLPLTDYNRQIVKAGLKALGQSKRPGIKAIFGEAGIDTLAELTTYHIGFIIAPRLNAMGRLSDALDSLRLLCTKDPKRAQNLAQLLGNTNHQRQDLTQKYVNQALDMVGESIEHLIVVDHTDFHEGVIGLVAGKLVEKHYRPSIVITLGDKVSKASARSVSGVNIIDLIRTHEHLLLNAGGHPMAAGFSIDTSKVEEFKKAIVDQANQNINKEDLQPDLNINCQIDLSDVDEDLFQALEQFKPFGIGNARPIFSVSNTRITDAKTVGRDKSHLKLVALTKTGQKISCIGFNLAKKPSTKNLLRGVRMDSSEVNPPIQNHANLAFTLDQNTWNGRTELQLKLKDIK